MSNSTSPVRQEPGDTEQLLASLSENVALLSQTLNTSIQRVEQSLSGLRADVDTLKETNKRARENDLERQDAQRRRVLEEQSPPVNTGESLDPLSSVELLFPLGTPAGVARRLVFPGAHAMHLVTANMEVFRLQGLPIEDPKQTTFIMDANEGITKRAKRSELFVPRSVSGFGKIQRTANDNGFRPPMHGAVSQVVCAAMSAEEEYKYAFYDHAERQAGGIVVPLIRVLSLIATNEAYGEELAKHLQPPRLISFKDLVQRVFGWEEDNYFVRHQRLPFPLPPKDGLREICAQYNRGHCSDATVCLREHKCLVCFGSGSNHPFIKCVHKQQKKVVPTTTS